MNKYFILSLITFLSFTILYSQSDAIIIVHRLKKSTNSGKNYTIWVNDRNIGKMPGVSNAFSQNAKENWLVAKKSESGKCFIRVTEGIDNNDVLNLSETEKEKERFILNVQSGKIYLIEFDASAPYGEKSLSVVPQKEAIEKIIAAKKSDFEYRDPELRDRIYAIDANMLLTLDDEINTSSESTNSISNNAITTNTSSKTIGTSDVDLNIPEIDKENDYRFALIIGNEDYNSFQTGMSAEVNVDYAKHDAQRFKEYCNKVLSIPSENIVFELNADAIAMQRSINKISLLIKTAEGKAEVFVYYAGHGLPDEVTKEPYLIPVNVSGTELQYAIKLKDMYNKLTEFPTKRLTIFLDACFSGGARNQGLVAARGVKVAPKEEMLKGNVVVFTSSSGNQSSMPYKDKYHGIFTYYLLKKLQETKGKVSYGELSNYLKEQVGMKSLLINNKEQNPQTNVSNQVQDSWTGWKLNE